MTDTNIAVLGGGIAGCLTACRLADLGHDVLIVEQRHQLMDGASRWNDGKIHLGYTFTGTPSLATAALLQEGSGVFVGIVEQIIGTPIHGSWWGRPVTYLVDHASIFDPGTLWERAQAVEALLSQSVERMPDLSRSMAPGKLLEWLDIDRASEETGQRGIAAAWRTTELQVSAREIATRVRGAVEARGIPVVRGQVEGVEPSGDGWLVRLAGGDSLTASLAVNCLWEGRALIDRQVAPESAAEEVVIRYKHCLFGTRAGLGHLAPSTRILGRFGDIGTYGNGDAYLSWYPAAFAARSDDGTPPPIAIPQPEVMTAATLAGLRLPSTTVEHPGAEWQVHGGYVVAYGAGDIDQKDSLLHTRDRPGVRELRPGYVSVDTGKYTLGPLLAWRAADAVIRQAGKVSTKRRRATSSA